MVSVNLFLLIPDEFRIKIREYDNTLKFSNFYRNVKCLDYFEISMRRGTISIMFIVHNFYVYQAD